MQAVELIADFASIAGGAGWVEASLCLDDLRDASAFDVLHGNEEAAVAFSVVVDFQGSGINIVQLFLDLHTPPLGFQGKLCVWVAEVFNYLKCDFSVRLGVDGKVDVGHASA